MSWQSYIDNMQAMQGVQEAAIYGCENNQVSQWATSTGFTLTADEVKSFLGNENAMRASGVRIGGRKCLLLRYEVDDKNMVTLQLKSTKDDNGKSFNATVYKTQKVVVVTQGKPDAPGGQVSQAALKYGEYLASAGY